MGRTVAHVPNENPDRLARVLDAKYRTIGVDKLALDDQVHEKKERERQEQQRDRQYADLSQHFDSQLCNQQVQAEIDRREWNRSVDEFRTTQQGCHTTREWDINRPDALKIDQPARCDDADARCGVSSLQKFAGEDLLVANRQGAQMEQCKDWWQRQQEELTTSKRNEKNEEMAFAEIVKCQEGLQKNTAAEEQKTRREANRRVMEENMRLAAEARQRKAEEKEAELHANFQEIGAALSSAIMTEDPRSAISALGANRVRTEHWKGMTDAETESIRDTLFRQVEEKKAKRQKELEEYVQESRMQHDVVRELHERARCVEDFRKEKARMEADYLRRQMEEKKQRDRAMHELYANQVAGEYFTQFGTSHR
ncbi:hypothetical protein BSKO_01963 [Bryopsis sp. KO-2023]|nr:hypothetical protein BSKO_01963 [Bryopsis sp. KO-2023]